MLDPPSGGHSRCPKPVPELATSNALDGTGRPRATHTPPLTSAAACRDTGYRVRVLTKERYTVRDMDTARATWAVDKNTVILVFDPSAPNIFGYGTRPSLPDSPPLTS